MLRGAGGLPGLVSTTPSKVLGPWSQCYSKGDGSSFCSPACLEFSSQPWLQLEPLTPKYSPELLKTSTKNTIASPAYSSENYCTTEGAATKSRDKTNKFMCFAIQWESAFWARLFIKLPQGKFLLHVTNCHRSSHILSQILHTSLQLSPVLVWNCCLAFWAVFPVTHEPACREDLKFSHSKDQWGIRKGRGATAVHSLE